MRDAGTRLEPGHALAAGYGFTRGAWLRRCLSCQGEFLRHGTGRRLLCSQGCRAKRRKAMQRAATRRRRAARRPAIYGTTM